jgi:excisionase family DNA binding protein
VAISELNTKGTVCTTPVVPLEHKILLSRHEAAQLLGISWRTLDELVRRGEIRIRRVGGPIRGRVLFSRRELQRFAEQELISSRG